MRRGSTVFRTRAVLLAFLALILVAPSARADQVSPDSAALRGFLERQIRLSRIPALAVSVVRDGQVVYAAGFGTGARLLTADSPFLIGSVSKTFTALAIGQLVDRKAVALDDLVSRHLPGFVLKGGDGGKRITLRHLLTHTSGLSEWSGHDRRAQSTGTFDHIAPVSPPDVKFEYSSLNYIILGRVIESVTGMKYSQYMQRNVFEPLEMANSFADLEAARQHGLVRGHWYLFGLPIPRAEPDPPAPLVPAGFLASSARDLANYLEMLLNGGTIRGRRVISSQFLDEMFKPWDGGTSGAGLAWGVGKTRIGHAGNTATFSARLTMLPKEETGIVVLSAVNNGPFFSGSAAVMDGVINILHGGGPRPVRPDEILLKLALLLLVLAGVARTVIRFVRWSRHGFPCQLRATRQVLRVLAIEAAAAALVLFALPRFIGVPLHTLLEYFPDLGIAILVGVITGVTGALLKAFLLSATLSPANIIAAGK